MRGRPTPRACASRRGSALLATLWALVALGTLAFAAIESVRDAQAVTERRGATLRATWQAEGCAARAVARIEERLVRAERATDQSAWRRLDGELADAPVPDGCVVRLRPAGAAYPLRSATAPGLRALFATAGVPDAIRDSLVDALLDWMDADTATRPLGAEATWYRASGRPGPRDGMPVTDAELAAVRGLETRDSLRALLSAEDEVIALSRAPDAVLATLPGIDADALRVLRRSRSASRPFLSITDIALLLPMRQRLALMASEQSIVRVLTGDPPYWTVIATAVDAGSPLPATVRIRVARDGVRPAVLQQRMPATEGVPMASGQDGTP